MSSVGIIHAGTLQVPQLSDIVIGYLITAAFLFVYPSTLKAGDMAAPVPEDESSTDRPRPTA